MSVVDIRVGKMVCGWGKRWVLYNYLYIYMGCTNIALVGMYIGMKNVYLCKKCVYYAFWGG